MICFITKGVLYKRTNITMEVKIQSIIFPTDPKHKLAKKLFYRGKDGILSSDGKKFTLGFGQNIDLATYLNSCSYRKWKMYTNAGQLHLYLDLEGPANITYVGLTKNRAAIDRHEFDTIESNEEGRRVIRFDFPENNEQMIGCEISALGLCSIHGGYFTVTVDEKDYHPINLGIATTTCRKEDFIKKNVALIKDEILNSSEEGKNIYLHVVDNGRTLSNDDINGTHVYLHPNKNTGGSGGYARGMMECMDQEPSIDRVLLMDDDILVLPESIKRTYNLSCLLNDEYKDAFISGAMLYYEEPFRQHEDMGHVGADGFLRNIKPHYDHGFISENLKNESEFPELNNSYSGWWYCSIPMSAIKKNGLPLPFFIRIDDVEFSLRNKPKFITMNGICVWHMGFTTKYNAAMNLYQECRNMLLAHAITGVLSDTDVYAFVYKSVRVALLKHNYDSAELVLRALEDYMKGPEFIMEDRGEQILKSNVKLNDKTTSLDEFDIQVPDVWAVYAEKMRKPIDTFLYRLTYNGQRFCPKFLLRHDKPIIPFDSSHRPQTTCLQEEIYEVNPFDLTATKLTIDKKRFNELYKRFNADHKAYKKNHIELEKKYASQRQYLTSYDFWAKYLELEKFR